MGLKSAFRFLALRLAEISIIALVIVFVPYWPPQASISESYSIPPFKPLTGKLAINNKLDDLEFWHKGNIHGPEAIIDHKGELYTGLLGGDVVKLVGKEHIVPVVKFGKPCAHYYEESLCGRPLGLQFGSDGYLYAMDAYYGLWKANIETGEKKLLLGPNEKIDRVVPRIFNSIAVASDGEIFFSSSSSQFDLHDGLYDMLADPSGRLIRYNPKTKTKTVLIDKLAFANGVVLSDDEEFVLVAETIKARILRYYLKGPKKGTFDVFVDGLPGLTDNLSRDGKGGFLVPLVMSTDEDHPVFSHVIAPFPLVRRFFARLIGITEWVFENVNKYYPNEFSKKAVYHIGHFTSIPSILYHKRTTLVRLSKNGEILDSLHTMEKKISHICDAHIYKDTLYLGSFSNDYIGKIPLSKIGWEDLRTDGREKRDTKPVETAKKAPKVQENIPKKEAPTAAPPTKAPEIQKQAPPRTETTAPPVKKETPTPKPTQQTPPVTSQKQAPSQAPSVKPTKKEPTTTQKPQKETVGSSKQVPKAADTQKVESKTQKTQSSANSQPQAEQQNARAAQPKPQMKPEVVTQKPQATQQKPEIKAETVPRKTETVQAKPQKTQETPQKPQATQQNSQVKPEVVPRKVETIPQKSQTKPQNTQDTRQKPQDTQEKPQVKPQAVPRKVEAVTEKSQTTTQNKTPQKPQAQQKPQSATLKEAPSPQKPAAPSKQPPAVAQPVKDQINNIPINNGPKK